MKLPRPTSVDFETHGIEGRPSYPPAPVSVSIKKFGQEPKFYAWGHPTGNNCTQAQAVKALQAVWNHKDGLLFQNGRFDIDVAEVHLGLKVPAWDQIHELMFLLFLDDPHQRTMDLKSTAHRLLGMVPEERDAVADWLVANQPVPGVKISPKSGSGVKEPFGKYIAWAPGDVVGPYANGDTVRTEALFVHLYEKIVEQGMLEAYNRERRLTPILLEMERNGIRVDVKRLQADVAAYNAVLERIETWVRLKLKVNDEVNLDSGQQLIRALDDAGYLDASKMGITKTGLVKSDKAALAAGCTEPQLAAVLKYATQLKTCLRTFMEPWLATALKSGGYIFTTWHQIRGGDGGARTGRFSSSPNFQNMPKEFEAIFWCPENKKLPKSPFKDLPPLPMCRSYITSWQEGHVLVGRDYSQQEPRILGHFEDGDLQAQYQENPWIDFHDNAKESLERIFKRPFKRKPVKNINLGIIYGQGVGSLAEKNGESVADTKELLAAILAMYPGLDQMRKDMKIRARMKQPIRTWGGRVYYCEPPMIINGRIRTFDYKLVNVLVQGSAADCTKEGMIRFMEYVHRQHNRGWRLILQVHDEIVVSVPAEDLVGAQEALQAAMESVEFDVKILSEGAYSFTNWAEMKDYDKKGKVVAVDLPKQRKRVKEAA
jgi:DNA polymerase-1